MKYQLTLLLFTTCWALFGQCPPGDVVLSNQAEVDAFIGTYPNCTAISGFLQIGSFENSTDITNLDSLQNLTSIGEGLDIV